MVYITRKEHFNAAHRLYVNDWSEEKNIELFGKCCNRNWHGHNYNLFVTVKGEPDPVTGFIINVKELSKIINKEVIDVFDHKNLNADVDFFKTQQPTTENFVVVIWDLLKSHLKGCQLHCIKLYETENIYAEYFGD